MSFKVQLLHWHYCKVHLLKVDLSVLRNIESELSLVTLKWPFISLQRQIAEETEVNTHMSEPVWVSFFCWQYPLTSIVSLFHLLCRSMATINFYTLYFDNPNIIIIYLFLLFY